MRYYIYKNEQGDTIGYNQTEKELPPPAIETGLDEFKALGFWIPDQAPAAETEPTETEQLRADVDYIAAITGVIL